MKNLPTLTLVVLLLAGGGFQIASALLADAPKTDTDTAQRSQQSNPETVMEDNPEAVGLIQQARNRLFERQFIQAEMSEVVTLGNYSFRSSGTYSAASGFRYRLEYQVELGDLVGRFLEVCDGQVLHTRREISEAHPALTSTLKPDVELSRRDIQRIRREAMRIKETTQGAELAEALRAAEIGIGGLPAVLASLERSMIFSDVRSEAIDGTEYLVVQGHWRKDRRKNLLTGLGAAGNQVAGFMPDLVRVYLAKETLFPEKFLYLKESGKEQKTYRPMVAIEYRKVILDQPVPERMFVYVAPPGEEERDETAAYLEAMRQTAEGKSLDDGAASPQE